MKGFKIHAFLVLLSLGLGAMLVGSAESRASGAVDTDGDGVLDLGDNCPFASNVDQSDGDLDGVGDVCDNCPSDPNPDQTDTDKETLGPRQLISHLTVGARSVFAADLDGDGDSDVLSASELDDKIAWYENLDGAGSFGPQQVITASADGAWSVFAADLDGDEDLDVLSASWQDDKIAWYENLDGAGTFGPFQWISSASDRPRDVFAMDFDGDGDMDVLSASSSPNEDEVAWYENLDGAGTFGPQQMIDDDASAYHSVFAADLDGDQDPDVLAAGWFIDYPPHRKQRGLVREPGWSGDLRTGPVDLEFRIHGDLRRRGGHGRRCGPGRSVRGLGGGDCLASEPGRSWYVRTRAGDLDRSQCPAFRGRGRPGRRR